MKENDIEIALVNPFNEKIVLRDFYSSTISKGSYNWPNIDSEYIFNPKFACMPCVGKKSGPFDNYPFKCPWQVRCKNTISDHDILKKLEVLNWIR